MPITDPGPWPGPPQDQFATAFGRVFLGPRTHPRRRRTIRGCLTAAGALMIIGAPAAAAAPAPAGEPTPAAAVTVTQTETETVTVTMPPVTETVTVTPPPASRPPAPPKPPRATAMHPPAAPTRTTVAAPPPPPAPPADVYYPNCSAARAVGAAPLYRGEPGYRAGLDRDGDGIACE
jgi:outer membrane biosynthesis protein TonB